MRLYEKTFDSKKPSEFSVVTLTFPAGHWRIRQVSPDEVHLEIFRATLADIEIEQPKEKEPRRRNDGRE